MSVKEADGRAALDAVATAAVETSRRAGMALPDANAIETFAREVAVDTVRQIEEAPVIAPPPPQLGESPAALDRAHVPGVLPEDATVINRAVAPAPMTPQMHRHLFGEPREVSLKKARLMMLLGLPEWRKRLEDAMLAEDTAHKNDGSDIESRDLTRWERRLQFRIDEVVELSNKVFGDYLAPPAGRKYAVVSMPSAPASMAPRLISAKE